MKFRLTNKPNRVRKRRQDRSVGIQLAQLNRRVQQRQRAQQQWDWNQEENVPPPQPYRKMGIIDYLFIANCCHFIACFSGTIVLLVLDKFFGVKFSFTAGIVESVPISLMTMFVLMWYLVNKER